MGGLQQVLRVRPLVSFICWGDHYFKCKLKTSKFNLELLLVGSCPVYKFWSKNLRCLLKTPLQNRDRFTDGKICSHWLDHSAVECGKICRGNAWCHESRGTPILCCTNSSEKIYIFSDLLRYYTFATSGMKLWLKVQWGPLLQAPLL